MIKQAKENEGYIDQKMLKTASNYGVDFLCYLHMTCFNAILERKNSAKQLHEIQR